MAHNPITFELIRTLDAIDRHGSFAAAAEQLHKVPSALTYTLQKCEKDLGVALFDRRGHRAEWTQAARHILREGRRILTAMDDLGHSAQRLSEGWTTDYTLAYDHIFEFSQMAPLIEAAQNHIPWVRLNVLQGALSGTWELLLEHQADLVVAPRAALPDTPGLSTQDLGSVRMALAVARTHPLAKLDRALTRDDLAPYPVVTIRDTTRRGSPLSAGLTQRDQEFVVPDMPAKISAQQQGLGVGMLPLHRIQREILNGHLIIKTLADGPDDREHPIVAGWRTSDCDRTHAWIMDHLNLLTL